MKTFCYLRVSTLTQDTEKNKTDILKFANSKKLGNVEFVEENITGKKDYKKRKLGSLLNKMQKGDILIVPELSRLARSIVQILEIIEITKQKGIILYSLKENFSNSSNDIASTVASTIFALIAQVERELTSLRTREALAVKKTMGIKLGRPKGRGKSKLDNYKEDILKLISLKVPKTVIARQYNTTIPNLYNFLRNCKVA